MSSLTTGADRARHLPWDLWRRQLKGVLSLEVRRNIFGRRAIFVYFLALGPVLILGLRLILPLPEEVMESIGGQSVLYAIIFRTFFLRLAVFFGCVGIFTRLFRGDVLERTLHYYFLAPARRELLVFGKYTAGVISNSIIFGVSTILSYLILLLPSGVPAMQEFLFDGPGLFHLLGYLGITVLACAGYGAVFLLTGLFFKNPIVPAAVILGWEYINFLLPPLLKKFSVIYYLESLCPVPIPEGPITLLAEPAPVWLAIPGIVGLTLIVLTIAAFRVRHMEVRYSEE